MQLPVSRSMDPQPSIFQTILEECSYNQIQVEESNHEQHDHPFTHQEIFKEHQQHTPNVWFWMHQAPFQNILEEEQFIKEDPNSEFHRVKSLREEQQTKIAQFLRDDKYKSLRCLEIPAKSESPNCKASQSLSPRKTKRIDKAKGLKLTMVESD